MPTYEYVCSSCGNQWEEIQKISEAASTECPKCHQATAKRQISGGRFILKGGGWYADLYSSTKPGKSGGSSSGSGSAGSSDSSSSSSNSEGSSSSSSDSGSSGSTSGSTSSSGGDSKT